ncbi:Ferric enterobactin transport protein FepE [Photobacterium damselae subsp. piscicida]|uniref:Chain-length determining protein n=2 Tax=Photobacterium damselae TaxID=38293 RepID=A0A1V1V5G6_PHODP|nr:Wzz/FepE/Etk N-terminal domain-containing protein [Photobacterium damselae]MBE8128655.1 chain-length determining protein [Photobacterium damselae subsp. piscicida]PSV75812.1 chain-length determining protein [Photobacterium damselae]PSW78448.1 chain-length determining protein [Photobacterium damselae]QOD53355.1 chain-length determining protein [Photobacterium damselae subsp. piscicida]QOD57192.1 chain-length determining protein [Photobacterium damselae subsp. piscicida]
MTQNSIQTQSMANSDEIDLVQLCKTLWQGKVLIIACSVLFTLIGVTYAFVAQQWWTSTATITQGQYQDTTEIRNQLTNVYAVLDTTNTPQINQMISTSDLLQSFVTEFNAFNNKKEFFTSNAIMLQYANEAKVETPQQKFGFIDNWGKKLSATLQDKKVPGVYNLTFQAKSAEQSHDLLQAYIQFINEKVNQKVMMGLNSALTHNEQMLTAQLIALQNQAMQQIAIETKKTEYALNIAKAADANQPMAQMDSNGLFSIDLGTKGLAEQVALLKNTKDLSLFEPKISSIKVKLDLLNQVKLDAKTSFESVRYLQNADYPIGRDKPKRALIVVLTFLLGTMCGAAIVLLRRAFSNMVQAN